MSNDELSGSDPDAKSNLRDERFLTYEVSPKGFNFAAGDNFIYVLPSCSNYADYAKTNFENYKVGAFFSQISVQTLADKYARNYRAKDNNVLTNAWWKLYNALGGKSDLFKKLNGNGFKAGLDYRCLLNVCLNRSGTLSPLRWFNVPAERPWGKKKEGARPRTLTMINEALKSARAKTQTTENPVGSRAYLLESCAMLRLAIFFQGKIPNITTVEPYVYGTQVVWDIRTIIPGGFTLDSLNAINEWAAVAESLPELEDIPVLTSCGEACEILGLSRSKVLVNSSGVSTAMATATATAPPVPAPVVQSPFVPQQGAPVGFGGPPVSNPPTVVPSPAIPVQIPSPGVPTQVPVVPNPMSVAPVPMVVTPTQVPVVTSTPALTQAAAVEAFRARFEEEERKRLAAQATQPPAQPPF
jgi:hypothetical protein